MATLDKKTFQKFLKLYPTPEAISKAIPVEFWTGYRYLRGDRFPRTRAIIEAIHKAIAKKKG